MCRIRDDESPAGTVHNINVFLLTLKREDGRGDLRITGLDPDELDKQGWLI
jgi:hypothetical protein